jgi:TPP-dependent pyruvate/acetoin dehydrogenase alpha subunit
MHLFDEKTRVYGGNAIVGGGLPLAVGLALADKMQKKTRVTCCFFGEGAVAEGEFHESLNLASLWQLPVLFVCENNLYAMGTALQYEQAVMDVAARAASYNMRSEAVDGMDVLAVESAAKAAAGAVRSDGTPFFLECRTYRFRAHSMYDPERYREKTEVEGWKKRGPIRIFTETMKGQGALSDADIEAIEREAAREISEAVAFAEACTWEPTEDVARFVLSERRRT